MITTTQHQPQEAALRPLAALLFKPRAVKLLKGSFGKLHANEVKFSVQLLVPAHC